MLICIPDDWALPPENNIKQEKAEELILLVIEEKKISYPAEIVGETGISRTLVFDKLAHMRKERKIEKINLYNTKEPPEELMERRQELWDMGLKGGMLRRMSWYRIPKDKKEGKKA